MAKKIRDLCVDNLNGLSDFSVYHIRINGHLDHRWSQWFSDLQVTQLPDGTTEMRGHMDQSSLHGYLLRIRDLGLELLLVQKKVDLHLF